MVAVRAAGGQNGLLAAADVQSQFAGRTYTLTELEQRGVRIAGGRAVCTRAGQDWYLDLAPVTGD